MLVQPSYLPGTDVHEDAVHFFANRARRQMATAEPALITHEMAVSSLHLFYVFVSRLILYSAVGRGVYPGLRSSSLL